MINGEWRLEGDGISGWASADGAPLWLELLANGEIMGICRTDLPEPNNCGFWLPVPAAALEEGAELCLRVANSCEFIGEAVKVPAKEKVTPLTGELALDRGLSLSGWALDSAKSEQKLVVIAYIDREPVARTIAGERRYRPTIADGHGFSLELPEKFADGLSHVVELKDGNGRQLPGSPFRIRCLPKNASVWLQNQKKIEKPLLNLIAGLLENMEERLPGLMGDAKYDDWKKAFPVQAPKTRQKATISLLGATSGQTALLKNQQNLELRIKADNSEFVFLPGNCQALHSSALALMIGALRERGAALVYADDEDALGPRFKPAWDREAFLARDYLGAIIATSQALKAAGITNADSPENARFKLIMTAGENILHLPMPLAKYPQTDNPDRAAFISAWLARNYPGAELNRSRIIYPLNNKPRVSIIIPTRDHGDLLQTCLQSLEQTHWPDYEIILIDNGTVEEYALSILREAEARANVCILRKPGVFNYAQLNNEAVQAASGEYVCFLNNDTEVLHPEWLAELARLLQLQGSGCVGAKLLWPNGLVQHGGVIIGVHKLAAHVGNLWLDDEPGYMGRNQFAQQYSAVTAACLLTPRQLFLDSGGFDARRFPVAFNDVDYCLRLRELGKKVYWTPFSRLAHHESASRGKEIKASARARSEREMDFLRLKWGYYDDPFYNPNLHLSAAGEPFHGLAFPPRAREAR